MLDLASLTKATLVSLLPWPILEKKPGVYPGEFSLDAAKKGDVEVLVVGESHYKFYIDADRGYMDMVHTAEEMARSVVNDFLKATTYNVGPGAPGFFWVKGEYTKEQILAKFAEQVAKARESQEVWFARLIDIAKDDWSSNQRRDTIPAVCKHAAVYLGLDFPWCRDTVTEQTKNCIFCMTAILRAAVICPNCHEVVDRAEYSRLKGETVVPVEKAEEPVGATKK